MTSLFGIGFLKISGEFNPRHSISVIAAKTISGNSILYHPVRLTIWLRGRFWVCEESKSRVFRRLWSFFDLPPRPKGDFESRGREEDFFLSLTSDEATIFYLANVPLRFSKAGCAVVAHERLTKPRLTMEQGSAFGPPGLVRQRSART